MKATVRTVHKRGPHFYVHLIRDSMQFASRTERKAPARALKPIYPAASTEAAAAELDAFETGPGREKSPAVTASCRRRREEAMLLFAFSRPVRRIIDTTNAIESLRSQVLKAVRTTGQFPGDEAATQLI